MGFLELGDKAELDPCRTVCICGWGVGSTFLGCRGAFWRGFWLSLSFGGLTGLGFLWWNVDEAVFNIIWIFDRVVEVSSVEVSSLVVEVFESLSKAEMVVMMVSKTAWQERVGIAIKALAMNWGKRMKQWVLSSDWGFGIFVMSVSPSLWA
jgi:hypothetical protein